MRATYLPTIFKVQAHALGLFFDEMINTFDPDALIIGGGVLEATEEFRQWFIQQIRAGMPLRHAEQSDIPIHVIPVIAPVRSALQSGLYSY